MFAKWVVKKEHLAHGLKNLLHGFSFIRVSNEDTVHRFEVGSHWVFVGVLILIWLVKNI